MPLFESWTMKWCGYECSRFRLSRHESKIGFLSKFFVWVEIQSWKKNRYFLQFSYQTFEPIAPIWIKISPSSAISLSNDINSSKIGSDSMEEFCSHYQSSEVNKIRIKKVLKNNFYAHKKRIKKFVTGFGNTLLIIRFP